MVIYRSDFEPSPERIRAIQLYLADLIKEVDTLDPRDFEAATAKGEGWATTMSFAIFLAVDRLESCLFPYSEPRVNSWPGRRIGMSIWPMYAIAAVERLLAVTEVLIMRWRAPEFCTKLRTAKGDDPALGDDPDDGTRYPIIEMEELAALRKINVELIRALADVEDEFPADVQSTEDIGVGTRPALELGKDEKTAPKVLGKTWDQLLNKAQFKILNYLLKAFPNPVLMETLDLECGAGAKMVRKLVRDNPSFWDDAIRLPDPAIRNHGCVILPWK